MASMRHGRSSAAATVPVATLARVSWAVADRSAAAAARCSAAAVSTAALVAIAACSAASAFAFLDRNAAMADTTADTTATAALTADAQSPPVIAAEYRLPVTLHGNIASATPSTVINERRYET